MQNYNKSYFMPSKIKSDFPIFSRLVHDKPLVYLDNAATTQKPQSVIDAIGNYYSLHNANVHRGIHTLADESTQIWQNSRQEIAKFFGAKDSELVLTSNTTESINAVAYGWGDNNLQPGDKIVCSLMEHHSNFVVWQELANRTGAELVFLPVLQSGELDLTSLAEVLSSRPKLLAISHVSNALGIINEIETIVDMVQRLSKQTRILIDGAQAVGHMPVNFANLGVDFYVASGHKMLGPMGIGVLLVKEEILDTNTMRPWLFGGGMIAEVATDATTYHPDAAERFTAGTPDVAAAASLAAAAHYLTNIGLSNIRQHSQDMANYAVQQLAQVNGLELMGNFPTSKRGSLVSFRLLGVHPHDVAQILDRHGVAVRSGHHCTMPLHNHFGWNASTRASWHIYNDFADIDMLVSGLQDARRILGKK